jgi:hypothetical protein
MRLVRSLVVLVVLGLAAGAGAALVLRLLSPRGPDLPDPPAVALRVREVARLEALEVALYKKVTFAPEPVEAGSFWGDVAGWLRHSFRTPRGKAIVFATAHIGLDLGQLDASRIRVVERAVELRLPPLQVSVELRPGDTEVIGSNLGSAETAQLLELARLAFQRQVEADAALRARARASAERSIRGLLLSLGFDEVRFVDGPATSPAS